MNPTILRKRAGWTGRTASPPFLLAVTGTACLSLILLAAAYATASYAACPNQEAREQNNSTALPDCRAYEMVSPLDKNGGDIAAIDAVNNGSVIEASPDGTRITYASLSSFGREAGSGYYGQYLSERLEGQWGTKNITVSVHGFDGLDNKGLPYEAFDSELTEGLHVDFTNGGQPLEEEPVGGAPAGYVDDAIREFASGSERALLTSVPPVPPARFNDGVNMSLTGDAASPDLHHIVFTSGVPLAAGATEVRSLYEWNNGHLEAVSVLPGSASGETVQGTLGLVNAETGTPDRMISSDGSRVFWTRATGGELFARVGLGTGDRRTIELGAATGERDTFLTASTTGSIAYFSSNATGDLYSYDLDHETLTELAPGAAVQGVLGASEDGSNVYLVAGGHLAPGAPPANTGSGLNLYRYRAGEGFTYITTFQPDDAARRPEEGIARDFSPFFAYRTARVSPDGMSVVFMSGASLTGYNSRGFDEVYEYDAVSGLLDCVSCRTDGAAPDGDSLIPSAAPYNDFVAIGGATYAPRVLSANGDRVFFDSNDAINAADTNGKRDVYEWERAGAGSCPPGETSGCVSLISAGTSNEESSFLDASENGSDVFFITRQELTPGDTDQEVDLYDAREDGGLMATIGTACTGTGCQGVPAPQPVFATPPTGTFSGSGNEPPAVAVKPKANPPLTRAQKLAKALKACRRLPKRRRTACRRRAERRYGAHTTGHSDERSHG